MDNPTSYKKSTDEHKKMFSSGKTFNGRSDVSLNYYLDALNIFDKLSTKISLHESDHHSFTKSQLINNKYTIQHKIFGSQTDFDYYDDNTDVIKPFNAILDERNNSEYGILDEINNLRFKLDLMMEKESDEYLKLAIEQLCQGLSHLYSIIKNQKDFRKFLKSKESQILDQSVQNNHNKYMVYDSFKSRNECKNSVLKLHDIIGLDSVKQVLKEALILPRISPQIFENSSLRIPWKLILLYGPPGTGKSTLVEALANETGSDLVRITCADILSSWFGESEKIIRDLFYYARRSDVPTILFIDEIDSICRSRSIKEDESTRRIKTELLIEFDKVLSDIKQIPNPNHFKAHVECRDQEIENSQTYSNSNLDSINLTEIDQSIIPSKESNRIIGQNLFVICATNCYHDLDEAFIRRFQQCLFVEKPNSDQRELYFEKKLTNDSQILDDSLLTEKREDNLKKLAQITNGLSCCDLENILREVSYKPVKELWNQIHWKYSDGKYFACEKQFSNIESRIDKLPSDKIYPRKIVFKDFEEVINRFLKRN